MVFTLFKLEFIDMLKSTRSRVQHLLTIKYYLEKRTFLPLTVSMDTKEQRTFLPLAVSMDTKEQKEMICIILPLQIMF